MTPERVLQAMQALGWPLNRVDVRLTAPVTATVSDPALEIESVSPGAGRQKLLRMACRIHAECLPFFASSIWPADAPFNPPPMQDQSRHLESPAGATFQAATVSAPPMIYAGAPAMLLLEGIHTHIRLPVFFAQSGHVGETVRVTTPDRRQTYLAKVLSPKLLQGEF